MIAVDTNLLVYAHRSEFPWQADAADLLTDLAASSAAWAIPWPCVHEFLAVVTTVPFKPPSTLEQAFDAMEVWLKSPAVHLLGEGDAHLPTLRRQAEQGRIRGRAVHDAKIAAICLAHGVTELWSADRDFSRYPDLNVVNPLVA